LDPLSTTRYIAKRLVDNWKLLLSVLVGVTIAATLVSGAPVYVKALGRIGFLASLEKSPPVLLNILTTSLDVPIDREGLGRVETSVEEAFQTNVAPIYIGRNRYVKTERVLLNPTPVFPRPHVALVQEPPTIIEEAGPPSLGHFMNAQDLGEHVNVVRGRMPGPDLDEGPPPTYATIVEAAIGAQLADSLGLDVGDELLLSAPGSPRTRAFAKIVGVIEPVDPGEKFWDGRASLFFSPSFLGDPASLDPDVDTDLPMAAFIIAPEAASRLPDDLAEPSRYRTSPAYFATATGLEQHVTMLEGRLPGDEVTAGPRGPIIEAMVGVPLLNDFDVHLGDVVSLTPFIDEPTWVSAKIVGIAEQTDPDDPYWLWGPRGFFVHTDPEAPPQLAILITREALVGGVAEAYPGTLGRFVWYAEVDSAGFEDWSAEETLLRLQSLEADLAETLPGQLTSTGLDMLVTGFERRIFLGSVPLLLLLTTMVVTVLYFVSMMVSYLVQSRERDVALLKTRGISTPRIFRLYGVEGLAVTVVAVVAAPFLAMGAIASAGRLSYFSGVTGGDFLPVDIGFVPFLVAAGVGILCLGIFVVPSVLGARSGVIGHKQRSSRPPSVPFFHRYYLDLGLLVIGGIIFWELHSRGNLVAGGLFEDVEVNETLLLAPVLLMIVVALLFMRFFPLVLKFISGESPALVHALVVSTVAILVPGVIVRELLDSNTTAWIGPVALLVTFAAVYVAMTRSQRVLWRFLGLVAQIPLVAAFLVVEPPGSTDLLVVPTVALIAIVPAQVAFLLLESYARIAPVWVSLALWRMARNPLQYTWLVLLLVLVSGLATFSYTIGATLDDRDEARIRYDVAADVRVAITAQLNVQALEDKYSAMPGVDVVSPALRARGSSKGSRGRSVDVLAVSSAEFPDISWYRRDFSDQRLDGVMRALQPNAPPRPLTIPPESTRIGVWSKLGPSTSALSLKMVIQDATGAMRVLSLGEVGREWTRVSSEVPTGLIPPLNLIAVQTVPKQRLLGLPSSVLLDDIYVATGSGETEEVLDDFEGVIGVINGVGTWSPMPTALDESRSGVSVAGDAYRGATALRYDFEPQDSKAIPGIYQSPSGGPLPVVASGSFTEGLGIAVDDTFVLSINDRLVSMVVNDTVQYFPTMEQRTNGFLIADFDLLRQHLDVREPGTATKPNELFIALASGAGPEVRAQIRELGGLGVNVHDRESISESFELNPLVTAGWRAVSLVSLGVVAFTVLTGIVTYLLFFSDRNRGEMGVVRALGLAHRQMISLLAVEHLLIAIVGMGLGTWAGLRMSSMMVPLVSLAESGGEVLPPILVTTNWATISVLYVAMGLTFAGMLFVINRSLFRWDLDTASRIES
jgi:ABC-type lipoprotein release transport system permease subunit